MTRSLDPACADFCRAEYPRLVGALSLYCGDSHLAQDCAQEALARACVDWRRVSNCTSPHAWALRVGINLTKSWFRRRLLEDRTVRRLADDVADPIPDAEDVIVLRAAVRALPKQQRAAVVLTYFVGLTSDESALVMRCAPATVRVHTHRGLQRLREQLTLEGVSYDG